MSYGYPPQQPPYGYPQPYGAGYGAPPPQMPPRPGADAYYPPPPFPPPAAGASQLPPGWTARFDDRYQSWYYVNLATAMSQWAHPSGIPQSSSNTLTSSASTSGYPAGDRAIYAPSPQGPPQTAVTQGYYGGTGENYQATSEYERDRAEKEKKKGDQKMVAGAVGGLLVGGALGAFAEHEIHEHREEEEEERREEIREALEDERAEEEGGFWD